MAESPDSVDLKTGLFGLRIVGGNALFFFLLLMLFMNVALDLWQHVQRSHEHNSIVCTTRLALFVYTSPRGELIDWSRMPVDLYQCIPKFLYERGRTS